ncbi:MAG TPA: ABC transporter substrate-binding protein [Bradyrhizobium sp.]|nr:ABC transporter substrate-binding protein [Bradyrhizobium sp.]
MNRRQIIRLIGAAGATISPGVGTTQAAGKRPLVVYFSTGREAPNMPFMSALLDGMRGLGYVEGQGFDIAYRFAGEDHARLGALAEEVVRLRPDVIVAPETGAALAAGKATPSIPIVGVVLVDPVGRGLIVSHARPGGNVTGILVAVEGLSKRQVEIVHDLLPNVATIGLMVNPVNPAVRTQRAEIETAAAAKGMTIVAAEASDKSDLDKAFNSLIAAGVQAVIVTRDSLFLGERKRMAELAMTARVPTVHGHREEVEAGGVISYGVSLTANYRRAAYFIDKILKGVKSADLPVEFPTKLEMVANLRSAKAVGIAVPPTLLAQADEVIE